MNDRNITTVTRRGALTLGAGAALATAAGLRAARAAVRIDITQGNVQPMPIALPDFVGGICGRRRDGAQRHRRHHQQSAHARACSRRSIRPPSSSASPIPTHVPRFPDWRQINAQALVTGRSDAPERRTAESRIPALGRVRRPAAGRPAIFHDARQLAAHQPHHLGRDLRAAHRREGLFRHPHRVRRRVGTERAPREAARDHGSGRRRRALSHARRRSRADAALLALDAGNHLHVVRAGRAARLSAQHRNRPARSRRQFSRHDVCAALFARRPARDHEPAGRDRMPTCSRWICARARPRA